LGIIVGKFDFSGLLFEEEYWPAYEGTKRKSAFIRSFGNPDEQRDMKDEG
jgi:hypothetical protein